MEDLEASASRLKITRLEEVHKILKLHDVALELSTRWGLEYVQYCPSCGYLQEEFHTEKLVIEFLEYDMKGEGNGTTNT